MSETTVKHPPVPTWTIGERMAKARDWAGLTQQQMAERLHIHRRSVVRYETSGRPPMPMVLAYSNVTGVPASWIEGGDDDPATQGVNASRCTREPWSREGYLDLEAA